MDFSPGPDHKRLRDRIVRFAQEKLNADVVDRDRSATFSRELWRLCAAEGLAGLLAPVEYGGLGLDALSAAVACEALGYGCTDGGLGLSIGAHLVTAVVPIWKFGNAAQKQRYLRALCDGSLIGVGAMTEAGSGSDAFSLATRAVPEGENFRLTGAKRLITNASVAGVYIVYAATEPGKGYHGGLTAFLVESDMPGCRVGPLLATMGLRTSPLGEIALEDVRVGPEAVLHSVGSGGTVFNATMDWERVMLMASHVGTMERLLERCIRHARRHRRFGQPIGKFQAISHRIADMKVRLEASRLLVWRAAAELEHSQSVSLDAAMAKLFVSESYLQTALDAVHLHGGNGYLVENELERAVRDATAARIYSGTSEMQRTIIAKWLGL